MRVILLLNNEAGTRSCPSAASLAQALANAGVTADIRQIDGAGLGVAVCKAANESSDGIVAAGGDGTISAVASALSGSDVPLGILPTGTLNHFARDLHIPVDLIGAARVIGAGNIRQVDTGEVNGTTFINNASIGLYPHMVSHRDDQRQKLGRGKWIAMFLAALTVLRRYPLVHVVLDTPVGVFPRITPFVFVGNNSYLIHLLALGARAKLDEGQLCVYFANRTGRFGLFRLMLRALIGRLNQAKDFDSLSTTHLRIDSLRRELPVAIDGEVHLLHPPLNFTIRPRSLRVFAP